MKVSNDGVSAGRLFHGAGAGIEVSGYRFSRIGMNGRGGAAPLLSAGSWVMGWLLAATVCLTPAAVPGILNYRWFSDKEFPR